MKKYFSCSITKELAIKTLPMIGGMIAIMSFQLIDSAFISILGVVPLAAQAITIPFTMVTIGIQVGLGIACTALISHYLGAKQYQQAKKRHYHNAARCGKYGANQLSVVVRSYSITQRI
ncbi:Putative cation efflux pump [Photobacterium profundum SS9]|uniref:Cation efflux pump n=1 Tax=Photobacterium profundum (strain SS9) TaxID=298386 RepID=Q6LGT6_PHOPR|nr:Putative cation efflux pump [Photobacterium profundum SS9]